MIYINREQLNQLLQDPAFVAFHRSGGQFSCQSDMFMLRKGVSNG